MSIRSEMPWPCMNCGTVNHAQVWHAVNVAQDPRIARKVQDGSLFRAVCRSCGFQAGLDYPIHYHDPARRSYCLYHQLGQALAPEDQPDLQDIAGKVGPEYRLRRVYDLDSLMELSRVWRDGLDDAAILALRLLLEAQVESHRGARPLALRFDHLEVDVDALEYVLVMEESAPAESMTVPAVFYRNVFPRLEAHRERLFPTGRWVEWTRETARQALMAG